MKLIEAMKKVKDLEKKADDLKDKVSKYCCYVNIEGSTYPDQKNKIKEWVQAHQDILKEILGLRLSIQNTNLKTDVTIDLGGKQVTKSIAAWIHRRRDLAHKQLSIWRAMDDSRVKQLDGALARSQSSGDQREVKVERCYDPQEKDKNVDLYVTEPSIIDARLEVANAVTDLIEDSK